jgi:N-acetylmuramoyl-L-alanine amidase
MKGVERDAHSAALAAESNQTSVAVEGLDTGNADTADTEAVGQLTESARATALIPASPIPQSADTVNADTAQPRITVTDAEIDLIAEIVWLEARGEPFDGQVAVAEVIINRVLDDRFPNTVEGVLSERQQFSTWEHRHQAVPTQDQYDAVNSALYGERLLTPDTVYFSRKAQTSRVTALIGDHVFCGG